MSMRLPGQQHTCPPLRCQGCGCPMSRDMGCQRCREVMTFWHQAQAEHPELSREQCILIGRMAAGLMNACVTTHGQHRIPDIHDIGVLEVSMGAAAAMIKRALGWRKAEGGQ